MPDSKDNNFTEQQHDIYNYSSVTDNQSCLSTSSKFNRQNKCLSYHSHENGHKIDDNKKLDLLSSMSEKIKKEKLKPKKIIYSKSYLTPDDKYFYFCTKADRKNTNQLVVNIRKLYKKQILLFDQDYQMVIVKAISIKYLPTTYINPIKDIRFNDYVFILDSNIYNQYNENSRSIFYGLGQIMKISQIEKNLSTGNFNIFLEDKYPVKIDKISSNRPLDVDYFKEWLMSLNNEKAKQLKDSLEMHETNLKKTKNEIIELHRLSYNTTKPFYTISEEPKKLNTFWLQNLNEPTKKWLESQHYCTRCYETTLESNFPRLTCIEISHSLSKLIDFLPILSNFTKGFDFCDRIQAVNFIDMHILRFQKSVEDLMVLLGMKGIERPYF